MNEPPPSVGPAPAAPPPGPRHRVLVVDDVALVGRTVREMLAGEPDVEVHDSRTPDEALLAAASLRPTVILQDLVMPNVSGAEMVRRFRALPETALVPVIVMSAVEEPATKADLLAGGASDYLVKLPDRLELAARVRLHSEGYARLVERNAAFAALERANAELARERERTDALLHAILPAPIADRLKAGPQAIAEHHADVTVLFADLGGFTEFTAAECPRTVVDLLDEIFGRFDHLAVTQGVVKIKTIGDAWMAVAGLPEPRADHAAAMAGLALDLQAAFAEIASRRGLTGGLRVGIHSGPVVAGVIGRSRAAYDLWGDTVNLASRMESLGEAGRIHVSADTAALLGDAFEVEHRGPIAVKGRGRMRTAFVAGRRQTR